MRVTKIIKEYIEREVNAKYQEKLDSIPNDYKEDYDKMIKELENLVYDCNDKAREIANKYGMLRERDYDIIDYHTYHLGDPTREEKRNELIRNLRRERDNKIAQIVLDLELGETTKKELNDVLANVEF